MKGRCVCRCVVCGLEKGSRDPNTGWWVLVPRGTSAQGQSGAALNFCPECAAALLVRSDEAQSAGTPGESKRWRIIRVLWLQGILFTLRHAGNDNPELRHSSGWRLAEKVAALIGFDGLPPALQLSDFGFPTTDESR